MPEGNAASMPPRRQECFTARTQFGHSLDAFCLQYANQALDKLDHAARHSCSDTCARDRLCWPHPTMANFVRDRLELRVETMSKTSTPISTTTKAKKLSEHVVSTENGLLPLANGRSKEDEH